MFYECHDQTFYALHLPTNEWALTVFHVVRYNYFLEKFYFVLIKWISWYWRCQFPPDRWHQSEFYWCLLPVIPKDFSHWDVVSLFSPPSRAICIPITILLYNITIVKILVVTPLRFHVAKTSINLFAPCFSVVLHRVIAERLIFDFISLKILTLPTVLLKARNCAWFDLMTWSNSSKMNVPRLVCVNTLSFFISLSTLAKVP